MTHSPAKDAPIDRPSWDVPKIRRCLRCDAEFPSEWSGERICPRCKSSNTWRTGTPIKPTPTGNGGTRSIRGR